MPGPFRLPEFNTKGTPNRYGMVFKEFRIGTKVYELGAINDRLAGWVPGTPHELTNIAVQGSQLASGVLLFDHPADSATGLPAGQVKVTIKNVTEAGQLFWVAPYTPVETYELVYEGAGAPPRTPLCKRPPEGKNDEDGRPVFNKFESIMFTGDRYDSDTKTVLAPTPALAPRVFKDWINIACAGSVPAKLHLNRHTAASQASASPGYSTTYEQRTAMLKMYAGDFCGSGNSYTVAGTPIHWENGKGQHSPYVNQNSWESLWDANGARCLDVHRLASTDPGFAAAVYGECPLLPKCNLSTLPALSLTSPYIVTQSAAL